MAGQKELGRADFRLIPGGAPGIEHRLALIYTHGVHTGRIDMNRFVDLISTRPARLFGLYPRKGAIAVGADADLVLWDPAATSTISARTHRHRCDRSIYEGFEVRGAASSVIAAGRIRFRQGDLRVRRGDGRFLERSPRSTS
jgi:dihydropyrimidinase